MKHIVSVSLGSKSRDHSVETEILGESFRIERIGTNGDLTKAIELIKKLDGKVDAFGMGGIDLYISVGSKRYLLRDAKKIAKAATKTPIVDGSGLKNTLERKVIGYLKDGANLDLKNKKVLMVCGVDRFGMADAFNKAGANISFGDLIFGLGLPIPINSVKTFERVARIIAPVISKVPFKLLYPTGEKQEVIKPKYSSYYLNNDIIAGDFLFIKKHMPKDLTGKVIITNTVTSQDVEMLKKRRIDTLITTTPELKGRSFGTNVMEALLVALAGRGNCLSDEDYSILLDKIGFKPRMIKFGNTP